MKKRLSTTFLFFISAISALGNPKQSCHALLYPTGQISFSALLSGEPRYSEFIPAYRSDLSLYMDLFQYRNLIFHIHTANTTTIAESPDTPFKLDRIRYTIAPGFRYITNRWILQGQIFHECIHKISQEEINGAVWWNTFQIGAATKGSSYFYLSDKYVHRDFSLRQSFDCSFFINYYWHGDFSRWVGQNHNYSLDIYGRLRYHDIILKEIPFYLDLPYHIWLDKQNDITYKFGTSLNFVLPAKFNMSVIHCTYYFKDDNPHDNENGLFYAGLKMIF